MIDTACPPSSQSSHHGAQSAHVERSSAPNGGGATTRPTGLEAVIRLLTSVLSFVGDCFFIARGLLRYPTSSVLIDLDARKVTRVS